MIKTIKPHALKDSLPDDAIILDVRTPVEHKQECLSCAHEHVPLDQLDAKDFLKSRGISPDRALYFVCRLGGRAQKAAELFSAAGCSNVHVVEGGLEACRNQGVPCSYDSRVISLERQVRIAAGALVVLATVLGLSINPVWHYGAAAIGAGLVFAGLTNFCGLALLLAKAPWNR